MAGTPAGKTQAGADASRRRACARAAPAHLVNEVGGGGRVLSRVHGNLLPHLIDPRRVIMHLWRHRLAVHATERVDVAATADAQRPALVRVRGVGVPQLGEKHIALEVNERRVPVRRRGARERICPRRLARGRRTTTAGRRQQVGQQGRRQGGIGLADGPGRRAPSRVRDGRRGHYDHDKRPLHGPYTGAGVTGTPIRESSGCPSRCNTASPFRRSDSPRGTL